MNGNTIQNNTVKYSNHNFNISAAVPSIATALYTEVNNIFMMACFSVSSSIVLHLKSFLKYIEKLINKRKRDNCNLSNNHLYIPATVLCVHLYVHNRGSRKKELTPIR